MISSGTLTSSFIDTLSVIAPQMLGLHMSQCCLIDSQLSTRVGDSESIVTMVHKTMCILNLSLM